MISLATIFAKLGPFVFSYAVFLLIMALSLGTLVYVQQRRTSAALATFQLFVAGLAKRTAGDVRLRGLSLAALDEVRAAAKKQPAVSQEWWQRLEQGLLSYAGTRAEEGYFLDRPVGDLLSDSILVDKTLNQRLARALPGLLTSAGLLGTFVAILLGLLDLKVVNDQVQNVGPLIANLSGKFVTSVVAILSALIISLLEIGWFRRIKALQFAIYRDVDRLLPQLTHIVLLRDMQHDALKRTVSVSNISSEVVDRFSSVFSTSLLPAFAENVRGELEPTLARVSESMDGIRIAIDRLEAQKQESVVGEFRALAAGIETTLRTSMEQMGREFRASLSGSASGEFDNAARALGASAEVLSGLNVSFTQMRESLDEVVREARRATEEQLANGSERAAALNALVEQLLLRLNDSATGSAERIQQLLAESVQSMQLQLGQLSERLTRAVEEATAEATVASTTAVKSATEAARLTQADAALLAGRLESALERMEGAGDALGAAQRAVRETISQTGSVLKQYEQVSADLRTSSIALAGAATSARDTQEALRGTMSKAGDSITQFDALARHQQTVLERQAASLQQVQVVFDGLDERLSAILGVVTERLQQHNRSLEQNFETILKTVNTEVPKVGNALFNVTTELVEQVQELAEVLDLLRQSVRTGGRG